MNTIASTPMNITETEQYKNNCFSQ